MLQQQLIEEIKQIPSDKLGEIYDLVHYFRLGLEREASQPAATGQRRPIGLAKASFKVPDSFFAPLPADLLDEFEGR
ncbi:hypothetical protein JWZ98_06000 [Methylomonas sp. EFPC1]|uniref:DUF2281 domain-containing protein n=1 Tax=Methylomonas defluvii TaxID=3045149 RepID=A0ABU4UK54_9GAMM|nr:MULTISPECIES: hypothetical protein [unclassified Methylomonas]MDX8129872.1 hypothetical protein [Methylomonas sp. OY6]PKD41969.1 hypothetical protein CWO84_02785 [Methylomonas sp. Kb3]QBC26636.1 hypothetical protein U737_06770 [Methylomonas sp. LW13]QSB02492.1 hypothetical protein JWZ98_06000 [Methylomonas sp. EFPC1]